MEPGPQLKIGKRKQQGRGYTGKKYQACPNCSEYYLRGMYVLDRNGQKSKWIKIGLYCEGCGMSWTYRMKENFIRRGLDYDI